MAINFDSLPMDKPVGALLDKEFYKGTIVKAEMKTPKGGGKDYMAITYDLIGKDGKSKGKFWDNMFDSDKDIPRYKLGRFITALELPIRGTFELKDLTKVVSGKSLVLDITVDEKSDPPRNQVDVFSNEIFYPVREWAALSGVTEVDAPFDAEDAADATETEPVSSDDY